MTSITRAIFCLLSLATFLVILANAWVSDDAYITFRVVDNFVHGYGLRWNIDERVQVYTHPLWMLLHIPFYAVLGHIFWVTIGLSAMTGLGAVAFLMRSARAEYLQKSILVLLPLALSKTFHDYIISGLETPLTLCLLGWFWYTLIHARARIYRLLFIASLIIMTRFDSVVLLLPPLLWVLRADWRRVRVKPAILALLPLIAWCGFSLLYYGFVFPNTKYAKLSTGIAFDDYVSQGAYYVRDFFSYDAFSFSVIAAALLYACIAIVKEWRMPVVSLLAYSIVLHLFYVICVGGDFMAGRFMVPAFYLSLLLLYQALHKMTGKGLWLAAVAMVGVYGLQQVLYSPRDTGEKVIAHHGVADERQFYIDTNTLFVPGSWMPRTEVTGKWRELGEEALNDSENVGHVAVFGYTGVYGFYAGPGLTIIDWNGLSDPLLARLPIADPKVWRIGHFERELPQGYLLARQTGDTSKMPGFIKKYYEKLRLVTSADLLNFERLETIMEFQLGYNFN